MIYRKLNRYIHECFFKEENIGNNIVMVVDDAVIGEFCRKTCVSKCDLQREIQENFNSDWKLALRVDENIPNIFGFAAIQIYIAYMMHSDGKYTAQAYNPRLDDYIGVTKEHLQNPLYHNYQDSIWQGLKSWADEKNFILTIPAKANGRGRYIQYPLSQALLNQEDLKKIPLLFKDAGINPFEDFSFCDFKSLIDGSDKGGYLTPHYYKIKESKKEELFSQLFSFYNNQWDGKYPENSDQQYVNYPSRPNREKQFFDLVFDENLSGIEVLDHNYDRLEEIALEEKVFEKLEQYYRLSHDAICFVPEEPQYNGWISNRYLEQGKPCVMLCKINSETDRLIHNLGDRHIISSRSVFDYSIYKINIKIIPGFFKKFFSKNPKNYTFENGLKLSRKTWMLGAGPDIRFETETDVWMNGKKLEITRSNPVFSCKEKPAGKYILKVKDRSSFRFEIKQPSYSPVENTQGWNISKKEALWGNGIDNFQFSGLTTFFYTNLKESNIRRWIDVLTGKTKKSSMPVVINAIKRAKYGI